MQLYKQSVRTAESNDIQRAAQACLLGISVPYFSAIAKELGSVPKAYQDKGVTTLDALTGTLELEFFLSQGWTFQQIMVPAALEQVLEMQGQMNPFTKYLIVGVGKDGFLNILVARGGEVLFDPSIGEQGLVHGLFFNNREPDKPGSYVISVAVPTDHMLEILKASLAGSLSIEGWCRSKLDPYLRSSVAVEVSGLLSMWRAQTDYFQMPVADPVVADPVEKKPVVEKPNVRQNRANKAALNAIKAASHAEASPLVNRTKAG
jgi:hypothetical protein